MASFTHIEARAIIVADTYLSSSLGCWSVSNARENSYPFMLASSAFIPAISKFATNSATCCFVFTCQFIHSSLFAQMDECCYALILFLCCVSIPSLEVRYDTGEVLHLAVMQVPG